MDVTKKRHQFPLRVPMDLYKRLEAHAQQRRLSVNKVVLKAVQQWLDRRSESANEGANAILKVKNDYEGKRIARKRKTRHLKKTK